MKEAAMIIEKYLEKGEIHLQKQNGKIILKTDKDIIIASTLDEAAFHLDEKNTYDEEDFTEAYLPVLKYIYKELGDINKLRWFFVERGINSLGFKSLRLMLEGSKPILNSMLDIMDLSFEEDLYYSTKEIKTKINVALKKYKEEQQFSLNEIKEQFAKFGIEITIGSLNYKSKYLTKTLLRTRMILKEVLNVYKNGGKQIIRIVFKT